MKRLLVGIAIAAALGMSGVTDAQQVRSTTHRSSHYTGHHHYRGHGSYHRGYRGGVGWSGYGGYGGVVWGGYRGYGYGGYVGYRSYPAYYGYSSVYVAPRVTTPRFVHYPARCPAPCLPQPVNVDLSPSPSAQPTEVVKVKEGEVYRSGDVIVVNRGGKLIILQAEETNGKTQGQ